MPSEPRVNVDGLVIFPAQIREGDTASAQVEVTNLSNENIEYDLLSVGFVIFEYIIFR